MCKYNGKKLLSLFLCAMAFLGLSGCTSAIEPTCGGVTDRTDHHALKTIRDGQQMNLETFSRRE